MKKPKNLKTIEIFWAYIFISLPILQILIFLAYPIANSVRLSFMDWDILSPPVFIGLKNFNTLAHDDKMWTAMGNTFYLMIGLPIRLTLGLFLALLLNRSIRGKTLLRVIYYLPAVISIVAASQMWLWVFNSRNGLVNSIIQILSGADGPSWFGDARYIKIPMIVMSVWGGLGPTIIFFLAALQNIPQSLFEAAELDGASFPYRIRHIVIPKVTPVAFFLVIMGMIGELQNMAQTYVMAGPVSSSTTVIGGPKYAAATMVFHLWQHGFHYFEMGYASTIAWFVAILIFIITYLNFIGSRYWVNYD